MVQTLHLRRRICVGLIALTGALCALDVAAQPSLTVESYSFEASDGRTVEADLGRFRAPENRGREHGRTIGLAFVRFPSTNPNPGPPIVYLAGGPGGSGTDTAEGTRFDLFQELRSVADVIAFDQRGTGLSERPPECPHQTILSLDVPGTREAYASAATATARQCAAYWRQLGVDLSAYNTEESADDLESLRQALGADKISLWAISYGTHLALSTICRHPDAIASAVLAGVEGPDHTLKLPSDQQALLEQIDAIYQAQNPGAPSLLEDIETVLAQLRLQPAVVEVEVAGETVQVAISAFDMQWLTAIMLGGPEFSMLLPNLFAAMQTGDFSAMGPWMLRLKEPSGIGAMSTAMDAASGASIWRRAQIATEAKQTLLAGCRFSRSAAETSEYRSRSRRESES